jgi:hypothetical protein
MTGLSRRRSRVRVPSLPLSKVPPLSQTGRDVAEALGPSDRGPIELVREWASAVSMRKLPIRTHAGQTKPVTADFFPA